MSNIWLTSDWHFGHKNITGPSVSQWDKGFRNFESTEQMNNTLIRNFNEVVAPDDTVWFLGDFAFGDKKRIPEYRERLNCNNIHLLYGNHDEAIQFKHPEYQKLFSSVGHYHEMYYHKKLVCMFHFPMDSWHKIGRGSYHAFGHCHGNHKRPFGRRMDVGVDNCNMYPISMDAFCDRMSKVDIETPDHHQGNE